METLVRQIRRYNSMPSKKYSATQQLVVTGNGQFEGGIKVFVEFINPILMKNEMNIYGWKEMFFTKFEFPPHTVLLFSFQSEQTIEDLIQEFKIRFRVVNPRDVFVFEKWTEKSQEGAHYRRCQRHEFPLRTYLQWHGAKDKRFVITDHYPHFKKYETLSYSQLEIRLEELEKEEKDKISKIIAKYKKMKTVINSLLIEEHLFKSIPHAK